MWISVNVYFILLCNLLFTVLFFYSKLISSLVNPSKTHHICTCITQFEDETCDVNEYRIHQAVLLKFIFQNPFLDVTHIIIHSDFNWYFMDAKKGNIRKRKCRGIINDNKTPTSGGNVLISTFFLFPYFKCDENIFLFCFWWRNIIHEHRHYFIYFLYVREIEMN